MKKVSQILLAVMIGVGLLASIGSVYAMTLEQSNSGNLNANKSISQELVTQFEAAANEAGFTDEQGKGYTDPRMTIAAGIRYVLSFVGTIFIALTVYAGILWMTAGGNDEQVTKSKKLLFQAVIGLFITFSAYTITLLAYRLASGKYTPTTCRSSDSGSIDSTNCTVAPGN